MPLSLMSVERVDPWAGQDGSPDVWIVRGYTVEDVPELVKVRTLKPWAASLCERARDTQQRVWVTWKDGRGQTRDLVTVELDTTRFQYEDGAHV